MTISERIESLRKQRGISLTYLNNAIGAYRGKLTEVGKGKSSLSTSEIDALAKALSTSTDYLLGNTNDPAPAGQKENPVPAFESGLTDPLDIRLMKELPELTPDQKELLLAQIRVLKEKK